MFMVFDLKLFWFVFENEIIDFVLVIGMDLLEVKW